MRKIFALATFFFAVMISSTALAANWINVDSYKLKSSTSNTYVDKDSIKRGIESKQFNISRSDGCSAVVKTEFIDNNITITIIFLVGFIEENGKYKYCMLDELDDNGNIKPSEDTKAEFADVKADGSNGKIWPIVLNFVKDNLK